jgi:hypothetical protein
MELIVLQWGIAIVGGLFVVLLGRPLLMGAQWYRNMIPLIMLSLSSSFAGTQSTLARLKRRGLATLIGAQVGVHLV